MNKTYIVISVCLELLWGYLDTKNYKRVKMLLNDRTHGKSAVYWLLNVLNKYKIPATWATVGGLFLEKDEIPELLKRKNIDYNLNVILDCLYGRDVVEEILSSRVGHELGYHTLTHTVLTDCPYDVAKFEVREGVKIAKKEFGVKMESFIFPKNKVGYLNILKKYGFKIFRGKNIWKVREIFGRYIQTISTGKIDVVDLDSIKCLPTSMLFDNPYPPPLLIAFKDLKKGEGKVFHISLHPESFLDYGLSLKYQFNLFLRHISKKRDISKVKTITMIETYSEVSDYEEHRM